jgi:hypothetical protein
MRHDFRGSRTGVRALMVAVSTWVASSGAAAPVRFTPAEEPDVPAAVQKPLVCAAPDQVGSGEHVVLRCVPKAGLSVVTVLLYYRQSGTEDFTPAPTLRTRKGWYTATLWPDMLTPGPLHYYFEAHDAAGKVVASSGDDESPEVLQVRAGVSALTPPALADGQFPAGKLADEDPMVQVRARKAAAQEAEAASLRRPAGSFYVGLGLGLGYGWYPDSVLDFRRDITVASGTGAAGPMVFSPEVGYQLSGRLSLSVLGRIERIGASGSGDLHEGRPATAAWAVLARGTYYWGMSRAQLFASAALGGGDGVRVVVPPTTTPDATLTLSRNDSVRGGPIVLGPSAGFLYHFNPHFAFVAEARLFAGLPDFATVMDFGGGLQLSF